MRTSAAVEPAVVTLVPAGRGAAPTKPDAIAFRTAMQQAAEPTPPAPSEQRAAATFQALIPDARPGAAWDVPVETPVRVALPEGTDATAPDSPLAGLRMGDSDANTSGRVSQMQKILHRWNPRLDAGAPGVFDRHTADALTLYKAIYGTGADGRSVDAATARNLSAMRDGTFWRNPPPKSAGGELLYHASRALGTPYRMGGDGHTSTDCGMLTRQAMVQAGHADEGFSRMADQQYYYAERGLKGLQMRSGAPQPGDLVFFDNPTSQSGIAYAGVTHVGLYVGDNRILAASSGRGKVALQSLEGLSRYVKGYAQVRPTELARTP